MIFYEPGRRDRSVLRHDPFKSIIAPRPIGWVSSMSAAGAVNLAPYSFFNAFSGQPPILAFASEGVKDTIAFVEETREFVWNMPTWDLRDAMNASSASLPRGTNEFPHAGLTQAPSRFVRPPRVAESPVALECKATDIQRLKDLEGREFGNILVLGQVVGIHIAEDCVVDGAFDLTRAKPIARCGGLADYAVVTELFQMVRPG